MKYFLTVLLLITTSSVLSQEWITDKDFEEKITAGSAFDEDGEDDVIVVEFWAEFNKDNAFSDWEKINNLEGVTYYRCDIATSPKLKKELRIRMAPTLLLYLKGDAYIKFTARAKLDLLCPVDYEKMVRAIEVVRREASY
jgi:hypothetical protein|tara:strand:- start:32922 stop:33341 length:420 start_codon:yes stop_codon:yes gene_type:complete